MSINESTKLGRYEIRVLLGALAEWARFGVVIRTFYLSCYDFGEVLSYGNQR